MAASWVTSMVPPFQVLPRISSVTFNSSLSSYVTKSELIRQRGVSASRTSRKGLNRAAPLKTKNLPVWEDPDNGSDSEDEDEEDGSDMDEYDVDYESDLELDTDDNASNVANLKVQKKVHQDDVDLVEEVEQLLRPEERAILLENAIPNLDRISTAKWIPGHTLALAGQVPVMDKLLENGLSIDMIDRDGLTALHKATIGKKEAVISQLLRRGANPHVRDQDGATPLHYAAQVSAVQTVKLLIKYKVDVNVADNEGWTPLHIAIQSRNRDIAKILLVNGADSTRRNKDGYTPLDLSLCYGKDFKSYDLAKLLKILPANRDY